MREAGLWRGDSRRISPGTEIVCVMRTRLVGRQQTQVRMRRNKRMTGLTNVIKSLSFQNVRRRPRRVCCGAASGRHSTILKEDAVMEIWRAMTQVRCEIEASCSSLLWRQMSPLNKTLSPCARRRVIENLRLNIKLLHDAQTVLITSKLLHRATSYQTDCNTLFTLTDRQIMYLIIKRETAIY